MFSKLSGFRILLSGSKQSGRPVRTCVIAFLSCNLKSMTWVVFTLEILYIFIFFSDQGCYGDRTWWWEQGRHWNANGRNSKLWSVCMWADTSQRLHLDSWLVLSFFSPFCLGGFFFIFLHYFACSHFFHNLPNLSKKKNNAINDHMRWSGIHQPFNTATAENIVILHMCTEGGTEGNFYFLENRKYGLNKLDESRTQRFLRANAKASKYNLRSVALELRHDSWECERDSYSGPDFFRK